MKSFLNRNTRVKVLLPFLGLALFTLFIISCSDTKKETDSIRPLNNDRNSSARNEEALTNPYAYTGELHNSGLMYIGNKVDLNNFTIAEAVDLSKEYLSEVDPTIVISNEQTEQMIQSVQRLSEANTPLEAMETLYNESTIDFEVFTAFEKIYSTIEKTLSEPSSSNSEFMGKLAQNLEVLEQDFLQRTYRSEENKITILGGIATARKSNEFWKEASINTNNPFHPYMLENGSNSFKFIGKIIRIIGADVSGFKCGRKVARQLGLSRKAAIFVGVCTGAACSAMQAKKERKDKSNN